MFRKTMATLAFLSVAALSAGAQAEDHIKIAAGGKGLGETEIVAIGQKQGIFAKHGIALDVFYTAGTGETIQAIVSGAADLGVSVGVLGVVGAYAKNAPLRIIGASYTGDSNLFWYVKSDSAIKEPKDAAGKTVAYSTNGSSANNVVLQMQQYLGVKFAPTATGAAPATLTQVMTGQVDVGWSGAPFGVAQIASGEIRVLWRASDVPALASQTSRVLIANTAFLDGKAELVGRFMDAYRETVDWIYSSAAGAQAYGDACGVSLEVAKQTLKDFVTKASADPDAVQDLDGIMTASTELKYLSAPLSKGQIAELIQIPPRK
ncbi:ABC transporter substrate-binding protein [Rhizobium sp. P32RR-XVIII]|uniref:ABC transporter substrate-binding protein n=1 Tax=Rhizobium sp. P32RR-XVIII TaxID=2726738 RepID=UPI001456BE6C|nr:ABC transporter substrate-binding protein [Rhizobium sp. P32RR-XVIII]NLS07358.1 ABC transporter substrate-binding protein [Rhizobium sp. P32RR-XVIII]